VIVIDTSALLSIFRGEDDAEQMAACLADSLDCRLSAATFVEAWMVLEGTRFALERGGEWLDRIVVEHELIVEPVSVVQAQLARVAFRTYGRGVGHPARLNFGDCFPYALAKSLDAPLLYKGDDFAQTDIASALS
jgi:ribonuclease VapC